ncbi:MAG: extracellular solute-binding protein [Oscillospiraceae bacterium]
MKKKAFLLPLLLAVALLLTACGEVVPKTPKTITLWHYYNADIKSRFDDLVQTFNETVGAKNGILVDAYSLGDVNELADAVYAAANHDVGAQELPDIFSAYSDSALRVDQLGAVATLDDYFTADELALYRPEFIEDGRFTADGSLKIMPVAKSTELSFVNLTAYEKFAAATGASSDALSTWEGIVETAKAYYDWSGGKAFFGMDSMANYMILGAKQLGEDIFTTGADGRTSLSLSPKTARKLWDHFYVPYVSGYFTAVGRFRSDDMKSGNIIMFVGSNSSASFFPKTIETGKDSSYETEAMVRPYPHFRGRDLYCVQQGAGMVVAKSDPETEKACVLFLKWLTAPEQNAPFAAATSYLPVQNAALSHEKTMEILNLTDETDILFQTSRAVYEMADGYALYASKPFAKSFDARRVLEKSMLTRAQDARAALGEQVAAGGDRAALLAEACGTENFELWYQTLITEIGGLLGE